MTSHVHLPVVQGSVGEADGLAVAPHVGVAADRVAHLREGQGAHRDGAAAQHLEAHLAVERDQEVLAHEQGPPHVGQAAQVLEVAPHQDGTFALLPKGAMDRQHVDVRVGAARLVERQGLLRNTHSLTLTVAIKKGDAPFATKRDHFKDRNSTVLFELMLKLILGVSIFSK